MKMYSLFERSILLLLSLHHSILRRPGRQKAKVWLLQDNQELVWYCSPKYQCATNQVITLGTSSQEYQLFSIIYCFNI